MTIQTRIYFIKQMTRDKIKIYSFRRCPFAIRVRMLLHELELQFEVREENLASFSAEFCQLHPDGNDGAVPLLVITSPASPLFILDQSAQITEHLVTQYAKNHPHLNKNQEKIKAWTLWCDQKFKPLLDAFKYENSLEQLQQALTLLEELETALTHQPYILGEFFSLADIHVFPFYRQFIRAIEIREKVTKTNLINKTHLKNINQWYEKILNRPCFIQTMTT